MTISVYEQKLLIIIAALLVILGLVIYPVLKWFHVQQKDCRSGTLV